MDLTGLGQGPVAASCKHGDETSGSLKAEKFVNLLSDYRREAAVCNRRVEWDV